MAKYSQSTDIGEKILDLISSGASIEDVASATKERVEKATGTPGLEQYAYDDIYNQALNYIANYKGDEKPTQGSATEYAPGAGYGPSPGSTPISSGRSSISSSSGGYTDVYKDLLDAQYENTIRGLQSTYETSLANMKNALDSSLLDIGTRQSGLKDTYYKKRNEAAAASDVGAMNFAQYMAARGIKGSAGGMPEIYRNVGLQGTLNSLNQSEAQANLDIENQRYNLKNTYNTNAANLANALQKDLYSASKERDISFLSEYMNKLKSDEQRAREEEERARQEWIGNTDQFYADYQAEIDRVANNGDPSDDWQIPYLRAERERKIREQEAAARAAAQLEEENRMRWTQINQSGKSGTSGTKDTALTVSEINALVNSGVLTPEEANQTLAGMGYLQTKGGGTTKLSDNAMRLKEQLDANAARGGDVTETILRPLLAAIRYGSLPEEEFIALMEYYGLDYTPYLA